MARDRRGHLVDPVGRVEKVMEKASSGVHQDGEQRLTTDESEKDTRNLASRPWHTRGRGDASADDSLSGEVGSQSLNTVDEDDADARHLLGPLLDDLGDGGPSTNRRGW